MIIELTTLLAEYLSEMAVPTDERLAELVRELTDCSDDEAGWSVTTARRGAVSSDDPLATVAHAMVLLRHQTR
jgi:hypothetical protein